MKQSPSVRILDKTNQCQQYMHWVSNFDFPGERVTSEKSVILVYSNCHVRAVFIVV